MPDGRCWRGLRLTLPYIAFDMTFADRLRAFQHRYPDILLDLSFSEAFVDVVGEGFHGGIRLGENILMDMMTVRLCPPFREVVFASPGYLAERGRPQVPRDRLDHSCIRYRYITSGRFASGGFATARGTARRLARGMAKGSSVSK